MKAVAQEENRMLRLMRVMCTAGCAIMASVSEFCFLATPAKASYLTLEKLSEYCSADPPSFKYVFCEGFIAGALQAYMDNGEYLHHNAICIPNTIKLTEVIEATRKRLLTDPEITQFSKFDAGGATLIALLHTYPCPNTGRN